MLVALKSFTADQPEMAMREETFGPVLPVMSVPDAETALRIANDSPMGLSGSVWSGDADRAAALARRLVTGSVCVNDVLVNYFCFESPLGGVKASGAGVRHGPEGLRQFCRSRDDHRGPSAPRLADARTSAARSPSPIARARMRALRWFMRWFY